jgi:hypothetical protein
VLERWVTREAAREVYGVALVDAGAGALQPSLDLVATDSLRDELRRRREAAAGS